MKFSIDIEGAYGALHPWSFGSYLTAIGIHNPIVQKEWVFFHSSNPNNNERQCIEEIQKYIDEAELIIGHHLKFDVTWLRHIGMVVPNEKLFCTMVAEYLLREQRSNVGYSLNDCAARYRLPLKLDKVRAFWEAGTETKDIPIDILIEYLKQDCYLAYALYELQEKRIREKGLTAIAELSFEVSGILSEVESNGLTIDVEQVHEIIHEYEERLVEIDSTLRSMVGFEFSPSSPQQLSVALYGGVLKGREKETYIQVLKSGVEKEKQRWVQVEKYYEGMGVKAPAELETKAKGYFETNKNALNTIKTKTAEQKEFVSLLIERSKRQKVLRTFHSDRKDSSGLLDVIGDDGRVHPGFNQTVTVTGRLSSSKPNGQNFPRKGTSPIKKVITSRNGRIINVDLAQLEWRVCGAYSLDAVIINEVINNIDAHTDNAVRFFNVDPSDVDFSFYRTIAKGITFGMIYGRSAFGFFKDKNMPEHPIEFWQDIVKEFYAKYCGLEAWQKSNVENVLKTGIITTPSGRRLSFPKVQKFDGSIGPKEQAIFNYPVQSLSTDIVFLAMREIVRKMKALGLKSELILQVHDSLVFDAFEKEIDIISQIAIDVFEDIPNLCKKYWDWDVVVPMTGDVEVGLTYGDVVKYTLFRRSGTKYLYSFFKDASRDKKLFKWVSRKKDITAEHPEACDVTLIDTIFPNRR